MDNTELAVNSTQRSVEDLLKGWRAGNEADRDELFKRLYTELRTISASLLRAERHTSLSTGDLVNEAAIRLIKLNAIDWQDKAHFLALAARAMRRSLIDHARKKQTNKRQHQKITLVTRIAGEGPNRIDLDKIEKALIRLSVLSPELSEIVELRYFGGMQIQEIAEVTKTSASTVKRNWRTARLWLIETLNTDLADD